METFFISKTGAQYRLGKLEARDIQALKEISEQWVRNRITGEIVFSEIASIEQRMLKSLESEEYRYLVVRDSNGKAVGMCAIREPEEAMQQYKSNESAVTFELINVFLDKNLRGQGVGKALLEYMFEVAKSFGAVEVIWNSGPRYKNSAWEFYTHLVGQPFAIAKEFYGEGGDAPVWRKIL